MLASLPVLLLLLAAAMAGGKAMPAAAQARTAATEAIRFCVDPDWPPYEVINRSGTHEGIAADLLQLAADRAGLALALLPTKDWEESLAASRRGDCDILSFLNQTPKREEWLVFTQPLFVDPNIIVTHEDHPFIADLSAETDKTIVLPAGTSIEERVRRDFPGLRVIITESEADSFAMVSNRKADLTIRSLTVAVYTIKKEGWFNLKVSGQVPGYDNRLRVGIRKERADLRPILDQAIATITPQERNQVANRHVSINVQTAIDYTLLRNLVLGFTVVLASNLIWALKLRQANARLRLLSQTDRLTGLLNRTALDERLLAEIERAQHHRHSLAVVLIDLDHFKLVNDRRGHLTGDQVLRDLAGILLAEAGEGPIVGRWGGEEFLVLCPGTTMDQARRLADHLRQAARGHDFGLGWTQTISAGIAELGADDSNDDLLRRADAALYRAKETRDSVGS